MYIKCRIDSFINCTRSQIIIKKDRQKNYKKIYT